MFYARNINIIYTHKPDKDFVDCGENEYCINKRCFVLQTSNSCYQQAPADILCYSEGTNYATTDAVYVRNIKINIMV